jgi:hypothetical protein
LPAAGPSKTAGAAGAGGDDGQGCSNWHGIAVAAGPGA